MPWKIKKQGDSIGTNRRAELEFLICWLRKASLRGDI